jgi:hypothetical protein
MRPLLEGVPLLRTRDLEAMRAFYAVKATGFEPIRSTKAVSTRPYVRVNGLYLANLWFGYVEFGVGAVLRLSPHSSSFRGVDQKKTADPPPARCRSATTTSTSRCGARSRPKSRGES